MPGEPSCLSCRALAFAQTARMATIYTWTGPLINMMSLQIGKWRRRLESIGFPAILIIWVTCGVVLVCQYKGMIPWFDQGVESVIVLVTAIPVLLLAMYVIAQVLKMLVPE